ncbi:MAG: NAD(P)-dependent oxidoreductase [Endomicrobium sp.]|jgi:UDP-glucose 4-epimerase|nr:NAD(P)-dependent oxidoreductase [Endomicrobium sp.]
MKNIIIFGATGTVGVYTALRLKQNGNNVIAAGKRKSDNGFFGDYDIPYFSVNISNEFNFNVLPQKNIDVVLHFAGAMPARMKGYDPYVYVESIVKGALNVLEYTRKVGAKKIIFTQSISDILYLFGSEYPIPADAEIKFPLTGDHSIYSISKNTAVNLIEHYFYEYGINRFILRLPTIYLYHPNPFYYVDGQKIWMAYRYLINQAICGRDIELWGNPESKKEIVYVKDFAQIAEKCVLSDSSGGVYNVGNGIGISMREQIQGIIDVFCSERKKSKIIYRPELKSSPQFILDISKTKELGYISQFDYKQYLIDFKEEMETEPFRKLWGESKDFIKE